MNTRTPVGPFLVRTTAGNRGPFPAAEIARIISLGQLTVEDPVFDQGLLEPVPAGAVVASLAAPAVAGAVIFTESGRTQPAPPRQPGSDRSRHAPRREQAPSVKHHAMHRRLPLGTIIGGLVAVTAILALLLSQSRTASLVTPEEPHQAGSTVPAVASGPATPVPAAYGQPTTSPSASTATAKAQPPTPKRKTPATVPLTASLRPPPSAPTPQLVHGDELWFVTAPGQPGDNRDTLAKTLLVEAGAHVRELPIAQALAGGRAAGVALSTGLPLSDVAALAEVAVPIVSLQPEQGQALGLIDRFSRAGVPTDLLGRHGEHGTFPLFDRPIRVVNVEQLCPGVLAVTSVYHGNPSHQPHFSWIFRPATGSQAARLGLFLLPDPQSHFTDAGRACAVALIRQTLGMPDQIPASAAPAAMQITTAPTSDP